MDRSIFAFCFAAVAMNQAMVHAQLDFTINAPKAGAVIGDQLEIDLSLPTQADRVDVAIGSVTMSTTEASPGPLWFEHLSLVGEPSGTKTLQITVYDSSNASVTHSVSVTLDRPPRAIMHAPLPGQVQRVGDTVPIHVTCDDDFPGCEIISASFGGVGPTPAIDESVAVPANAEGMGSFKASARDSAGQTNTVEVPFYVESGPYLRRVLSTDRGEVIDFDGTRSLVLKDLRTTAHEVTASGSTEIYTGSEVKRGYLYPGGAVVTSGVASNELSVWLWNGTSTAREPNATDARVTRQILGIAYDIWVSGQTSSYQQMVLRDVQAGTILWTSPHSGYSGFPYMDFAFGTNGNAIWAEGETYITKGASWRYNEVVSAIVLPSDIINARLGLRVAMDPTGANALVLGAGSGVDGSWLLTSAGMVSLCRSVSEYMCSNFALNNGWAAYAALPPSTSAPTPPEVYRRSPAGEIELIPGRPHIDALSPSGELMMTTDRRYRFPVGQSPVAISTPYGRSVFLDRWYVMLGHSVFEVLDSPDMQADAGADAGVADAGMPLDAGGNNDASGMLEDAGPDVDAAGSGMDAATSDAASSGDLDAHASGNVDSALVSDAASLAVDADSLADHSAPELDASVSVPSPTADASASTHDAGRRPGGPRNLGGGCAAFPSRTTGYDLWTVAFALGVLIRRTRRLKADRR